MYYLKRSIEEDYLEFGLEIECPTQHYLQKYNLDPNRDGERLLSRLRGDSAFVQSVETLIHSPEWQVNLSIWDGRGYLPESVAELLDLQAEFPEDRGWTLELLQTLTAAEVIAAREGIADRIVATYRELQPLWLAVIPSADRDFIEQRRRETANIWWVNQGASHAFATREEFLWAPLENEQGTSYVHWRLLDDIQAEDVIIHYYDQAIQGLSRARRRAKRKPNPFDEKWEEEGRMVDVEYYPFASPIPFAQVREPLLKLEIADSPFTTTGGVKQGYLWRFDLEGLKILHDAHDGNWPSWAQMLLPDVRPTLHHEPREEFMTSFDLSSTLQRALALRGLHFTPWQIATFYTALQTKGFVILSGISGTGKTKLAQAFSAALPQPTGAEIELPDDLISLTVQPYMLKYNRIIIPKHYMRLFVPPERGEAWEVKVTFDGQQQTCRLHHADYANTDYVGLYLRGKLPPWFKAHFDEEDVVVLEPRVNEEGALAEFRMSTVEQWSIDSAKQSKNRRNTLFVPVRTDWRDSKSLLGYYNPLTGSYEWTPFLRFLMRAVRSYQTGDNLAWFVILDEMNLARVEYYFADLLSVLESGRDREGWTREPMRIVYPEEAGGELPPHTIHLPPNLYVIGTVNVDETTHTFSPKVLDRAFTLELTDVDFLGYPLSPNSASEGALTTAERQALLADFSREGAFATINKQAITLYIEQHPETRTRLQTLNERLRPYHLHFGYRVFDEIVAFLVSAEQNRLYAALEGSNPALDAAVLMKVLPKFHGSRRKLLDPLYQILAWCMDPESPDDTRVAEARRKIETNQGELGLHVELPDAHFHYPKTAARVRHMLWSLYTTGFAAFG
jgi:energy-coupling factor transporter ATP-binding protein EcfA2